MGPTKFLLQLIIAGQDSREKLQGEMKFDSEDSDEECLEEDFHAERGRRRYNLRPNPELIRRYEGFLANYLAVLNENFFWTQWKLI